MNSQAILSITSILKASAQKVGVVALVGSIALMSQLATAASNIDTTIPLDMAAMNVTQHEIALMHVLSDLCPPMLNAKQKPRFYKSYNVKLHKLMPTLEDPKAAIQYLSTHQDYQKILGNIRTWTMGFSKKENKELCQEFVDDPY